MSELLISDEVALEGSLRELMSRELGVLSVSMYWQELNNVVIASVVDTGLNRALCFLVPNDKVLDAFDHPFPYAAAEGLFMDD